MLTRRLAGLPLMFLVFAAAFAQAAPAANLVAIVTDDQGRWAMGAYGNHEARTPNMDRIARQGIQFTNAIACSPVCSPSRAAYFSGLYPTELGVTDWISPQEASEGLGLHAATWPQVLQRNGYRTAMIGKWHLGDQPRFHPRRLGFDHFTGFLAGGTRPMNTTLEVDGKQKKTTGPLPDVLVDDAIAFITKNRGRPFAVCLHFRAPHLPYGPVPKADTAPFANLDPTIPNLPALDAAKVKRSTKAYYASIHSVDRNIGRLLETLDTLQLSENTLVIFTSDHGYNEGRHYINTKGNGHWIAGGISGPKRPNMWETSIAVPLAMRWPAVIKPGAKSDVMVSNLDMFRTVLGALGIPLPADIQPRGIDFSPLLRGESIPERTALFGQYDLHNNGLAYLRMVRTRRYKYVKHFHARMMDEVYDLEKDPGEQTNLLRRRGKHRLPPEVFADLERRLKQWQAAIKDPLLQDAY